MRAQTLRLRLPRLLPAIEYGTATARPFLAAPFDALRFQYAGAVMAGIAPRSLQASGRLERCLDALESLILGPLARHR